MSTFPREYTSRSGQPCQVRAAESRDMHAIASIYEQGLGRTTFDLEPKRAEELAAQALRFESEGRQGFYLTQCADRVIGWGVIKRYSDRLAYDGACETSVFFDDAFLRQGHGTRMKKALLEECRRLGYHHVVAKIVADNTAAIRYNQHLGYELVGIQKRIGRIDGRYVDVCLMQCLL